MDSIIASADRTVEKPLQIMKYYVTKAVKAVFRRGKNYIKYIIDAIIRRTTKIQPNKIAIMTITFRYNCNPRYIFEEIERQGLDYEIVWLVDGDVKQAGYPEHIKVVRYNSIRAFKEVYSSKILLDNGVAFSEFFTKKDGQIHIQTMHGSLGIKRLDNSIKSRMNQGRHGRKVIQQEQSTEYILTNSQFEEDVFQGTFWKNTEMLRLGHARTDALFGEHADEKKRIRHRLKTEFNVPEDKKIILYGPTHRKGLTDEDLYIDFAKFCEAIKKKFGGDYVFLLRLHYKSRKLEIHPEDERFVYNVTNYPDIQDLMLVADVAITDYSSWIYDFVLTGKPGIIYATDLDKYNNITGLYYPLEETPFPVCMNNETLIRAIGCFDMAAYQKKVEKFLEEKECVDDGKSAERAVNWIKELQLKN